MIRKLRIINQLVVETFLFAPIFNNTARYDPQCFAVFKDKI